MSSIFACDLGLNGKTLPRNFFCRFVFVFEKFSWTSTGGNCALHWFYCVEKQKLSLERTPPGKKLRFCKCTLFLENERETSKLKWGVCFSMKWKATRKNWAHLEEERNFGLKSHLRGCCRQPFNFILIRIKLKCTYSYSVEFILFCNSFFVNSNLSRWPVVHMCTFISWNIYGKLNKFVNKQVKQWMMIQPLRVEFWQKKWKRNKVKNANLFYNAGDVINIVQF